MSIIVFVRGISSASEIVPAIEPNMALLAGVFMADNYYTEYSNNRIQVFYRYPLKKKYISVVCRCLVNWVYLLLLVIMAYGGFIYVYRPMNFTQTPSVTLFIGTILVSGVSILFMGSLAFTITNFTQSIGTGISITVLIWGCLSSNVGTFLPKFLQLFLLEEPNSQPGALIPYYLSRLVYLLIAIGLLTSNRLLLKKTGLLEQQNKKNRQLSGGMKRRVGLVQALIHNPSILIVDEPTTGLDPEERIRIRNLLVDFASNRIVLFSTHVTEDLAATCDKLCIMSKGKIIYDGGISDLIASADNHVFCSTFHNEIDFQRFQKNYRITSKVYKSNNYIYN